MEEVDTPIQCSVIDMFGAQCSVIDMFEAGQKLYNGTNFNMSKDQSIAATENYMSSVKCISVHAETGFG